MEKKLIEEALSLIWEMQEVRGETAQPVITRTELEPELIKRLGINPLSELVSLGKIEIQEITVRFTAAGEQQAVNIIRRQRLAERLLVDILDRPRTEVDSDACEFEHIISGEVEQSICTLLGHPKECPHGSHIPAGACCRRAEDRVASIIVPLSRLQAGESGRVAYLLTQNHPEIHRLLQVGLVPGSKLILHQTYPAFVIQVGETQLAMEPEIAEHIYLRREGESG